MFEKQEKQKIWTDFFSTMTTYLYGRSVFFPFCHDNLISYATSNIHHTTSDKNQLDKKRKSKTWRGLSRPCSFCMLVTDPLCPVLLVLPWCLTYLPSIKIPCIHDFLIMESTHTRGHFENKSRMVTGAIVPLAYIWLVDSEIVNAFLVVSALLRILLPMPCI